MGPFSGNHMQQFVSSNVCQHGQLVCHGPSAVWMPLWLVLQLVGLQAMPVQDMPAHNMPMPARPMQRRQVAPESRQQGGGPAEPGSPVLRQSMRHSAAAGTPPQQQEPPAVRPPAGNNNSSAGRHSAAQHTRSPAQQGSDDDEEYEYGVSSEWLKRVKAVEAATKARQQEEKQQRQSQAGQEAAQQQAQPRCQQSRQDQQQHSAQQEESWEDTEMEDVSEAVLAAVSQLRGDQEYLEELHRAIDMDWEPASVRSSDSQQQSGAAAGQAAAAGAAQAVACNAVDLAALPAGAGTSAVGLAGTSQEQEGLALVLVLDTNVLLEKKLMRLLRQLQHLQQQQGGRIFLQLPAQAAQGGSHGGHGDCSSGSAGPASMAVRVQAVVPWTVLVELDRLKMRVGSVANEAKAAVEDLRSEVVMPHDKSGGIFVMQSLQDFRQAAKQFDFGMPASDLVGDDRILQCALSQVQQLQERQHSQQGSSSASGWSQSGVLLLSNDKVMQLKARANGVAVAGLYDIPQLSMFATAGQLLPAHATEALQQPLGCLVRLLQLAGVNPPWLPAVAASTAVPSQGQPASAPASASLRKPAYGHTSAQWVAAGNGLHGSPRGSTIHSSMALDSVALYGGSPRAGSAQAKQRMLHEHQHQQPQQQHTAGELSAAATSFLTFLRLTLASQVEGWFRQDLEDMWTDVLLNKPPWNDVQFLEVLEHHFSSTIKAHLAPTETKKAGHIMTVIHNLVGMAKRVHKQHFKGIELSKLPFNVGVRVMEILNAFGAQEAAQQVQAALSAAATAGPTTSSSRSEKAVPATAVPNMQAYLDSAASGTAASASAPAPAPAQAGSKHTTGNGDASQTATDSMQDGQLLQRQQQHTQQHSNAATVAALAAAAAAVPAPQPVGSCLTLCQLLMYAVSLLQAVLPLLGQGLSDAAAAAAAAAAGMSGQNTTAYEGLLAAGLAHEQQLRAVVQQLEKLGQHVGQGGQQHWLHHQQQWQQTLHQEILQTGLQLVELCSFLLNDEAARSAVSQQLMLHANEFVSEAARYLVQYQQQQQQQQGDVPHGPAVMLQQLTAALQHLQQLLKHVMQRS